MSSGKLLDEQVSVIDAEVAANWGEWVSTGMTWGQRDDRKSRVVSWGL